MSNKKIKSYLLKVEIPQFLKDKAHERGTFQYLYQNLRVNL